VIKLLRQRSRYPLFFLCAMSLFLQSCSFGAKIYKEASSIANVKSNEVIIVGKINLIPKLEKNEQQLDYPGRIDLFNYSEMNKSRAILQLNTSPEVSSYKYIINPKLGKFFFFKVPRRMKYIVDAFILTEFTGNGNMGKILLPAKFKININNNDRAVYVGDITYTRDDFNSIIDIKYSDGYKKAFKAFKKKFGNKYFLRKALLSME